MIKLFYYPGNANLAPHILLEEMGVPYQLQLVDRDKNEHKSEAYLNLNPTGRIPAMIDDGLIVFESAAICLHLCDKYPDKGLIPKIGTPERTKFYTWLMYLTNTIQPEVSIWWYSERYTADSSGVSAIKAASDQRLNDMFTLIDQQLAKHGPFFLGKDYTAIDPYLLMVSRFARKTQKPPRNFPVLGKYLENLLARPAVQHALQQEGLEAPFI
ncbi:MAG: glutathione S-transferase family protein [Alphaproteobacteria bacterium]